MIGSTLSHYSIEAELGRGGMGIVYRATDMKLNRVVALKILPAAALSSEDDRARFFREAQAAAQLHHAHIATVFEIDEAVLHDAKGNLLISVSVRARVSADDDPDPRGVHENAMASLSSCPAVGRSLLQTIQPF